VRQKKELYPTLTGPGPLWRHSVPSDLLELQTQRAADLAGLIATGRGDTPLVHLRWRCAECGSRRIDMVCTSHARVVRLHW
jgi:hypothetical protein